MENISSEQELKQLLDEGKVTEQEYQELLEAIRQKETTQELVEKPNEPKPRTGYGKAALILMISGILLPIVAIVASLAFNFAGIRFGMLLFMPFLFLGFLCELLAFIFGIIGWKTAQGKIAAIGVPCLGLLIVPGLLLLSLFSVRASHQVADEAVAHSQETIAEIKARQFQSHWENPLDMLEGLLTKDGVRIDYNNSSDGKASLKVTSDSAHKQVIQLFETGPMDVENRMLIYSAQLMSRLEGNGRAYLEMWCDIPGKGEFFSRGLEHPVTGTTDWITFQTPFRLEHGQMPANVKLNLIIEGVGTVWIDDVKLSSSPLD